MDAFRKQLDVLMGANRNGDVEEVNRNYYDRDVCRLFLAGLCPHDLFQLTVSSFSPLMFGLGILVRFSVLGIGYYLLSFLKTHGWMNGMLGW